MRFDHRSIKVCNGEIAMFFYVSLFVASVISALAVLYFYNALADVGKEFYRAFLPGSKDNRTKHLEKARFNSTVNKTAAPWGWKGNDNVVRERDPKDATVNGASGLDALLKNHGNESASVGWPYREEKTECTGTAYKVSRKAGTVKTSRKPGNKQPWGW